METSKHHGDNVTQATIPELLSGGDASDGITGATFSEGIYLDHSDITE